MENIIFQLENIKNKEIKHQEQKQLRSKGFICLNEPQPHHWGKSRQALKARQEPEGKNKATATEYASKPVPHGLLDFLILTTQNWLPRGGTAGPSNINH